MSWDELQLCFYIRGLRENEAGIKPYRLHHFILEGKSGKKRDFKWLIGVLALIVAVWAKVC